MGLWKWCKLVFPVCRKTGLAGFGLRLYDSFPDLFVPLGFAGGLTDPDTGLTRFGWRDYDPAVGRFTAPDPLGDTGGDHDLYEYRVDDPVSMCDPEGLIAVPIPLLIMAGKALGLGMGLGGAYVAAGATDWLGNKHAERTGRERRPGASSTPAWDGVNEVMPKVVASSGVSIAPGLLVAAPGAVASVARRIGATIHSSPHAGKIIAAGQFAEGVVNPNPPAAATLAGSMGTIAGWLAELFQNHQNSKAEDMQRRKNER